MILIIENQMRFGLQQKGREASVQCPLNQLKAQRSGFELERRRKGADGAFSEAGSGRSGLCADEVKLIRAQGECLGIRSR